MECIVHPFNPIYDQNSRVLILGTMASPASRKAGIYYGHPQNRFWRIMGDLFLESTPMVRKERIAFCYRHRIALWDVLKSCEIRGAQDGSIRDPVVQPLETVLNVSPIRAVFTNGQKAHTLYMRYVFDTTDIADISLPSTSPANCRYAYVDLLKAYRAILPFLADD